VLDKHKQAKLRHGELEIRFERDPFPLYPGEKLSGPVQPLVVVAENTALRLKACTLPHPLMRAPSCVRSCACVCGRVRVVR
jgi:hypothetical protein